MKQIQILLILAMMFGQSVLAADKKPLTKAESAKVIEAAIRKAAKKPVGELTKADSEKVTFLNLFNNNLTFVTGLEKLNQLTHLILGHNQLTDVKDLEKLKQLTVLELHNNKLTNVKGLEKLTQLKELSLDKNPDLTKAQIDQLKKALPKCEIYSNPTKQSFLPMKVLEQAGRPITSLV